MSRQRAGRGASVSGAPADDALQALVQQFSERSAFVRELIQNALDAGAGRVEVRLSQERGRLRIDVEDDGEGMDRDIIEGYLLTLFRSSKEKDLTKIGKFGVGFVSLFALLPELVVVNTARDGVSYRVLFDEQRNYTLAEVAEPFEGTTISIFVAGGRREQQALAEEIRAAVHYWCRYARAEIWTSCEAKGWGWEPEEVVHPFTVDTPHQIVVEEEGLRVAMGFSADTPPQVGYYNHGLTLLEAREDAVPGVSFRVEARVLEHTLTRDNVIRDRNYRAVVRRLAAIASESLQPAWLAALKAAIAEEDWARHAALLAVAEQKAAGLPEGLACLRTASGGLVSISALRPGLLRRMFGNELLYADGPSPLAEALAAEGRCVLLGPVAERPEVGLATRLGLGEPIEIHTRWMLPEVVEPHPLVSAVAEGIGRMGAWRACLPARFTDRGDALADRLVSWQASPGALEHRTVEEAAGPPPRRATLLINVDHPVFVEMSTIPARLAAPLLRQAVLRATGDRSDMAADLLQQALEGALQ